MGGAKKPGIAGTSPGQLKKTTGNTPGGKSQTKYWEWDGNDWNEISKELHDAGGTRAPISGKTTPANTTTTAPEPASLRYPKDIDYTSADYMIFEFFNYKPPFQNKDASLSLEAYNASGVYTKDNKNLVSSKLPQIVLYMPEGISASYKANWDGKKFGNIAAGVLAGAGAGADGDIGLMVQKLASMANQTAKRAPAQLGAQAVSAIIGSITGDSVTTNDIFSSVGGQILNPNAELIFGGHDLRTFTFSYKLVPYNEPEAKVIFGPEGIIATFKRAMLPSYTGNRTTGGDFLEGSASQSVGFIKNPNLVQPYFMNGNAPHKYLPNMKVCTITDFDVNYTSDGVYAAHSGGVPVAADIKISLTETKLLYSEDIGSGY